MNRSLGSLFALSAALLFAQCAPAADSGAEGAEEMAATHDMAAGPSIQGTYRLAYRELPDGTRVSPPKIDGLITFTAEYRNFNLMWEDADGALWTIGSMSRYSLSETEYTEELIFRVSSSGGEMMIQRAGETGASPVTLEDGELSFTMPLDEPDVVFLGDRLTATREGEFVDYWERVN